MVEKFWLDWARSTIARGDKLPFPSMDREDKAEFYGDLASAYELLAEQAAEDGDNDAVTRLSKEAERYTRLAEKYRPRY